MKSVIVRVLIGGALTGLLSTAMVACGGDSGDGPLFTGQITRGGVATALRMENSNTPVEGAMVAALSGSDVTDSNGNYSFRGGDGFRGGDIALTITDAETGESQSFTLEDVPENLRSYAANFIRKPGGTYETDGEPVIETGSAKESISDNSDSDSSPDSGSEGVCGDGLINLGEECDDGNTIGGDGCSSSCTVEEPLFEGPICGDGLVDSGEFCDDGNTVSGDGCSSICTVEDSGSICGNSFPDPGEECDDGNTIDGDGCSSSCTVEEPIFEGPICGDGLVDSGEFCDDGNTVSGDGCSSSCQLESNVPPGATSAVDVLDNTTWGNTSNGCGTGGQPLQIQTIPNGISILSGLPGNDAVTLTEQTPGRFTAGGLFFFGAPDHDIVVLLDGCDLNLSASNNSGGSCSAMYHFNPLGTPAEPILDGSAFATCP